MISPKCVSLSIKWLLFVHRDYHYYKHVADDYWWWWVFCLSEPFWIWEKNIKIQYNLLTSVHTGNMTPGEHCAHNWTMCCLDVSTFYADHRRTKGALHDAFYRCLHTKMPSNVHREPVWQCVAQMWAHYVGIIEEQLAHYIMRSTGVFTPRGHQTSTVSMFGQCVAKMWAHFVGIIEEQLARNIMRCTAVFTPEGHQTSTVSMFGQCVAKMWAYFVGMIEEQSAHKIMRCTGVFTPVGHQTSTVSIFGECVA